LFPKKQSGRGGGAKDQHLPGKKGRFRRGLILTLMFWFINKLLVKTQGDAAFFGGLTTKGGMAILYIKMTFFGGSCPDGFLKSGLTLSRCSVGSAGIRVYSIHLWFP
jgi:hypothetical protein